MHSSIYLKHYRLPTEVIGSPLEGTFKATDSRSGAPVSLTLIPVSSIAEEEREEFERRAHALTQFDHLHVARLVEFGREGNVYAFVSESPLGETAEEWVAQYGRMPPEAVLRVGIQVVSAAGAAAFQQIFHRAINPANLLIVPGQMAEGGWPAIKLINLVSDGFAHETGGAAGDIQFASPEQLRDGTVDFRSEVYSLGATMSYLLTGAFYSAEPKSLQTRRFARPLRKLLWPMLRQNPEERPQDPVLIADALRSCLETVERRQLLARRFGIPFIAVRARETPKPRLQPAHPPRPVLAHMGESGVASAEPPVEIIEPAEPPPSIFSRWALRGATAMAILLGLGLFAAALMPGRALALLQGRHEVKQVGVTQPAPIWEGQPLHLDKNKIPVAAATASPVPVPQPSVTEPAPAAPPANQSLASNNPAASQPVQPPAAKAPATESANEEPAPPSEGPQSLWEKAGNRPLHDRIASRDKAATAAGPREETSRSSEADQSAETDRSDATTDDEKPVVKRSRSAMDTRPHPGNSYAGRPTLHTGRASARMAADGSVILRLPDGQIAVIPPTKVEYVPRRTHPRRRVIRQSVYPDYPTGYPYYSPRD